MTPRPRSLLAAVLVACTVAVASVIAADPPVARAVDATEPAAFTPITPCRLIDTRTASPGRMAARDSVDIVARGRCGVADTATIVAVTVTAVDPLGPGFLTAYPNGEPVPDASIVNYGPGDVIASQQFVPVGADDSISVFSLASSHLVVDVAGYFEPAPDGTADAGRFVPVSQRRLLDTRDAGRPRAGSTLTVDPALDDRAAAVVVNVTTTETRRPGFFSAFPSGSAATDTSVLNVDRPGQTRAAGAVVLLDDGAFDVFTSGGDHVIVDLIGYFTSAAAPTSADGLFVGMTARRLVDTRLAPGPTGGPKLWDRGGRELAVDGIVGPRAAAISASVAVTRTEDPGFAVLYPAGSEVPATSTVNYDRPQRTVANGAIVGVSDRGVAVWAHEATHVVIDVSGWFTGEPQAAGSARVRNDPPPDRRVTIIGDSAMAGVRWNGALGGLRGFEANARLESCRRLATWSCRGREGYAPRSVVSEIQHLGAVGPEEILVIATGYNDWHGGFADAFDAVIAAARAQGYHHVAWVDYRDDVGYRLPGSGGARSNYGEMNRILDEKLASGEYPDVRRWYFDHYTAHSAGWFTSDGVHQRQLGSWGVADWISRHVRAFDDRPCAMPWVPGAPVDDPCPDPDTVVQRRGVPDVPALYGL